MMNNTFNQAIQFKYFLDQQPPLPGVPFTDPLFPPNRNSLLGLDPFGKIIDPKALQDNLYDANKFEQITFARPYEIFGNEYKLFSGKIEVDDIKQGIIGDCYFLTALGNLCKFPGLILKIFKTKEVNKDGYYEVIFRIDGKPRIVIIDDYIPVMKANKQPCFSRPNGNELWVMLLEKAWAKVNGGYLNIVSCSLSDLFRALTGFSCLSINTKEEEIFNIWNIIKNAFNNKWLVCGTVRGDEPKAKKHGLVNGSTYNFLFGEDIYDNSNKKQILIKLKNSWGANVWSGDYSDGSNAWTESIIEQIGINRINKNSEGEFWMSLKDICKYFETIDICQIVFGAKTFNFSYKGNNLLVPHIYNINLKDTGVLSISAYEKKWRFNRELKGVIHPTSLILGEYDPDTKEIKKIYSNFSCDNDAEIAYKVNGGYYILWVYKPSDLAKGKKPDFLKIRISSDEDLSVKYIGQDSDFLAISDIVARNVRYKNRAKIKKEEFFYEIKNSLDKSGIAYRVVLNDTSDLYEDWDNDASSVEGIYILPPYNKNKKFLFRVGPNSYCTVLGIQKEEYGTHWFNLKSKISQMPIDSLKDEEINNPLINPNTIYTTDFDNISQPDYITTSYDVSTEQTKFPIGKNHKYLHVNKLKSNYNRLMSTFSKSFPSEMKNNKLVPTEIKKGELTFFGESNPKTKEGRGVFYDTKNDMILVTTWKDQDESSFGQIYNNLGNIIYEGEMVNGVAHGKGTFFFPGGEKYYGNFENGIMEGNGIFYWEDGSRWEGTFSNNKLHGDGVFYNPKTKTSFNASYKNNRLIEESNFGYGSMRKNRGGERERDRDKDRERERDRDDRRENIFRREKERDKDRDRDRDSNRDSYKEKESYRKENLERDRNRGKDRDRENGRKILFRGRGKQREKKEIVKERVGERYREMNMNMNMDRDSDKDSDKDNEMDNVYDRNIEKERLIEIDNDDDEKDFGRGKNKNKLGSGILRFKKREIFREKNQREYEREKPKQIERDSEENNEEENENENEEEDEKVSDKEEENSQNEIQRQIGKYRMFQMGKNNNINRFNNIKYNNNKREKYKNKKEGDNENDESDE